MKNYDFIISAHPKKETKFYSVITDYFWVSSEDAKPFSKDTRAFYG